MSEHEKRPHCNHFVIRKKRYCRIGVKQGEEFCGEHKPLDKEDSEEKLRIVCPLDPKHTCYAHNLRKHLKICNARPGITPPYIQKGINSGKNTEDEEEDHKLLSSFSTEQIKALVSKINKIYEEHLIGVIKTKHLTDSVVEEEIAKPEHGDKSKKHLKQASAILGLLKENNLINPKTCFIEFGAGRGQLSYWLAQTVENASNSSFLLVERSSPKHKQDNKLGGEKVQRIRADIADLILDKIEAVEKSEKIIGVTKHLCGDATDLALRCLSNISDRSKLGGCLMTFCCHHRCRWLPYTGKQFFKDVSLTVSDFHIMCGMSSWATCGTGFGRNRKEEGGEMQNDRDKEIGLNRREKEEVGRRSKAILNWGRVKYVEGLGCTCALYFYVGEEISPENVCIVAYHTGGS